MTLWPSSLLLVLEKGSACLSWARTVVSFLFRDCRTGRDVSGGREVTGRETDGDWYWTEPPSNRLLSTPTLSLTAICNALFLFKLFKYLSQLDSLYDTLINRCNTLCENMFYDQVHCSTSLLQRYVIVFLSDTVANPGPWNKTPRSCLLLHSFSGTAVLLSTAADTPPPLCIPPPAARHRSGVPWRRSPGAAAAAAAAAGRPRPPARPRPPSRAPQQPRCRPPPRPAPDGTGPHRGPAGDT